MALQPAAATVAQWEYCQLALTSAYYDDKRKGWYYDVHLDYLGPDGSRTQLATWDSRRIHESKAWAYNPWKYAIALLGQAGWELVTVQHGGASSFGALNWNSDIVAYFKRQTLPGRRISEPPLVLP